MSAATPPLRIAHYRADVDGLRAVAILLVLWFHAFPDTLPGGYIGVDVFFVISGYLITGIVLRGLARNSFSFAHFYAQRARRLLPALMLVLPATLAAGWHWLWPQELEQLGTHTAAAAMFVLNFVLWGEAGYFDVATELKPLMHLWSLGIEEQFYLVYPWLLWLAWRLTGKPLLSIIGLIVFSFAANLLWLAHDPAGAFFLPHTRFWELALGGLLAWHQQRSPDSPAAPGFRPVMRHAMATLGLAAIVIAAVTLHPGTPYPGTAALLPVGGSLLLIASGPNAWVNLRILSARPMVLMGLISYPLYLWHWPILSFLRIVHADTPPLALRAAAVALSILLAWMTFRFVETPVRFGARRAIRLAGVALAVSVTAMAAWGIRAAQGIPARLPADAIELLAYRYNYSSGYREGSCFLRPEQEAAAFAACPDRWSNSGNDWLLWGDSHAAHLRPGIEARYGGSEPFVQRSASGCAPITGEQIAERPHCAAIQQRVWQEIEQLRPKRVTLAARWDFYDWQRISDTVHRLRNVGVQHIELVGPVPQWRNGLPRQLAIAYREAAFSALPTRLRNGLLPLPFELDAQMRTFADTLNVKYFSPIQALCNESGCLTLGSEAPPTLTAWDDAHLTQSGSEHVVNNWLEISHARSAHDNADTALQ